MKRILSFIIILSLLVSSAMPQAAFAQTTTPTPPPSDPTMELVNSIANPATDPATQQSIQPALEQYGPTSPELVFTPPPFVVALTKEDFQAKEQIEVVVKYSEDKNVSVQVTGENDGYTPVVEQEKVNGDTIFTLHPTAEMTPGSYEVKVIDNDTNQVISTQDFTWGVLAINTNKSIYLPNEAAAIAIAVLDEKGLMVCNAMVDLEITSPWGQKTLLSTSNGLVKINNECLLHEVTEKPDYETSFVTSSTGRYEMKLTATTPNGSYTTKDRFEVRDSVPFDIERITATRIYPPEKYPVKIKIKANEDFVGKIVESVPSAFQISYLEEQGVYGYVEEVPILENIQYEKDYGIPDLHLPFPESYPVSQGFGQQIDDPQHKNAYKNSGLDGHDGIDFALPSGTPILAVDEGTVILAKENWIYGTSVVIQHSWGRSYYGHLSRLEVTAGAIVARGGQIGLSGSTGLSTGPHLHLGIKPTDNDIYNLYFGKIDPSPYLGIATEDPVLTISDYPVKTKALVWNLKIPKGAEFTIGYQYLAPPKSPDFYTIGPLQFISSQSLPEEQAKFDVTQNPFVLSATTSATQDPAFIGPPSPNNLTIEQFNHENKDRVIFQEIRPWQLAIDVSTTVVLDANGDGTCGSGCWTVPSTWTNTNVIYAIGGGGAGDNTSSSVGMGGGGGGSFSSISNTAALTPGNNVTFNVGSRGSDGVNGGNSWLCSSTTSCTHFTDTNVIVSAAGGTTATSATGGAGGTTTGVGTVKFAGGAGGNGINTGDESTGGGGGAGSPYGTGGTGGNGDSTSQNEEGHGGGGGAGCDTIGAANDGAAGTATGGAGGASCFASGGTAGAGDGGAGSMGSGGGGGGGTDRSGGNGGNGLASMDPSMAGGGGGGGDDDVGLGLHSAGAGGNYGGGSGGSTSLNFPGGGVIVITWTLTGSGSGTRSAPTLADYNESTWTDTSTSDEVTGSISWQAGDIILVFGSTEDTSRTLNTPTATGLSFSLVTATAGTNDTQTYLWSATAAASGSSTVSSTHDGTNSVRGLSAFVYRNHGGIGNTNTITDSTAKEISLTRSKDNSAVAVILADWAAINDVTVTSTPGSGTERVADNVSGLATNFVFNWGDQSTAGTTSYGITNHTGTVDMTGIVVEVLGCDVMPGMQLLMRHGQWFKDCGGGNRPFDF